MDIFSMEDKRNKGTIQVLRTEPHVKSGVIVKEKKYGCVIHSGSNKTFLPNHFLSPIMGLNEEEVSGWTVMPDDFFSLH